MGRCDDARHRRRRSQRQAASVVACALLVLIAGVAGADPVTEAEEQLDEITTATADAEQRLAELEVAASQAVEAYNEARERHTAVEARLAAATGELRAIEVELNDREERANAFVRALYQRGSAYEIAAILDAESIGDVRARAVYLRAGAEAQYALVAGLDDARLAHAASILDLRDLRDEADDARRRVAAERGAVESLLAAQQEEIDELRVMLAEAEQSLEAAEQEQQRIAELARAEEEAAREAERQEAERRREQAAEAEQADDPESREPAPRTASGSEAGQVAVDEALAQLGKPYQWGGGGPDSYDCSGLTKWAWAAAGVNLPHSSRMQLDATERIGRGDLEPGDLVFFGSPIHHVAIYIGDGEVVEAPYSGETVRINSRSLLRSDIAGYGRPRTSG
jgi:peptidoglycan DL-endopeptidase CwlO